MNKHVERMKTALTAYQEMATDIRAKIEENNRIYRAAEAEKANDVLLEKLHTAKDDVMAAIDEAKAAGYKEASEWGVISAYKMTDDVKLFSDGHDITPAQFSDMVTKYQDNSTMLQLLKNYADNKNKDDVSGFMAGWGWSRNGNVSDGQHYDTSNIPTVESKCKVIGSYAESATDLLNRMCDTSGAFGSGVDSPLVLSALESFGAEADY